MNRISHPIDLGAQNDAVANLQDDLRLLLDSTNSMHQRSARGSHIARSQVDFDSEGAARRCTTPGGMCLSASRRRRREHRCEGGESSGRSAHRRSAFDKCPGKSAEGVARQEVPRELAIRARETSDEHETRPRGASCCGRPGGAGARARLEGVGPADERGCSSRTSRSLSRRAALILSAQSSSPRCSMPPSLRAQALRELPRYNARYLGKHRCGIQLDLGSRNYRAG
jgi:hypothetical protein